MDFLKILSGRTGTCPVSIFRSAIALAWVVCGRTIDSTLAAASYSFGNKRAAEPVWLTLCLLVTTSFAPLFVGTTFAQAQQTPAAIYRQNIRAVFTIYAGNSLGTGFVVAPGLLATNAHVVGDSQEVDVAAQDGTRYKARVVKKNVERDYATLEFEGVRPFQTLLPLQRSSVPDIGEGVVVIGSPLGSRGTVTTGIVSQILPNGMIQLNASVNPGNSGGPVFDMQGRVFGIATAKATGPSVDGLAFAIPIVWLES